MNKEKKYNLLVALLSLLFFFVYSYLSWSILWPEWSELKHIIFNWPDANANFYFARLLAEEGVLSVFEPLNQLTDNLLHTRSINVFAGSLVPITFLPGIVIFALFAKIFGTGAMLFLTPALASLTVYLLYRLSYYIFKDLDLSLIISGLLLPLGPWLYFSNIVMLPTIMFIFFVVGGFLALAISLAKNKWFWYLLSAFLFSLAIILRPTEIVWLAVSVLIILYWNRSKFDYKKIIACLLVFVVILFLNFYLNKITYGSYFASGYFNLQSGGQPTEFSGQSTNYFKLLLAPFGFDFGQIVYNFAKYFIKLNWPLFVLAVFGFMLLTIERLKEKKKSIWYNYYLISFLLFILILLYYGSWDIADPLVKNLNQISISYVRYFLPLYILLLPLAAYAIKFIGQKYQWLYLIVVLLVGTFSWQLAFYSQPDGLVATKLNLEKYRQQYLAVRDLVEDNAIIISERSDKVFFPAYKVVAPQGDLPLWSRIANIVELQPIYYFSDKSDELISLDRQEAETSGLLIEEGAEISQGFKLYKIISLKK
ncbi:hypothetical protein C4566_01650 [Candidatus Parcubacteria bacterium]|nr:MAG: hypothetical protein C4566_01650 [Candidatus Parcubacteria bacterium]